MFIGTRNGILKSTNGGYNFTAVNNGIPPNSWVWDLDADYNNIIAAATTNGLFVSTNLGSSWQQTTGIPSSDTITAIAFLPPDTTDNGEDGKLVAGSDDGKVFASYSNTLYLALVVSAILGSNQFIDGLGYADQNLKCIYSHTRRNDILQPGGGVFQSTNRAQTFTQINEGLPNDPTVSSLEVTYHFAPLKSTALKIPGTASTSFESIELFAGLFNNTNNGAAVYRRTINVGIQQISSEIPEEFSLSQNYPNPFNPVTKIRFDVTSNVKLAVYNSLGKEVATLVNEKLNAGTYEVEFNGSSFTSGIYFYRLDTEKFSETKRMILLK